MRKAKEPVKLRQKKLNDGNMSLYLDIYVNGKRSYEFLKLYLIPETNKQARERNKQTLEIANEIKLQRIVEIQSGAHGMTTLRDILFIDYFDKLQSEKKRPLTWRTMLFNFKQFTDVDSLMIADITPKMLVKFKAFMESKDLKQNSIAVYMSIMVTILRSALEDGYIYKLPITKKSRCSYDTNSKRCYLTIEELQAMFATPFPEGYEVNCRAFLFSSLTGLRKSDVIKLKWEDVEQNGERTRIVFTQKKTRSLQYLDINPQAAELMGERGEGLVFKVKYRYTIDLSDYLREWAKSAGVNKDITFHSARHTFATMMLTLGTDLYVVSKLLGHANINTTQVYAKIVDTKKQEAIDKIPKMFKK